jgi:hypothetical protein
MSSKRRIDVETSSSKREKNDYGAVVDIEGDSSAHAV